VLKFHSYIKEADVSKKKSAGNFLSTKDGAGMTAKGVKAYRAKNPGSNLILEATYKLRLLVK